ncbi:MATE family efflux transporter [Gracilibacillus caseinilyticus]|uniref:MATE family efflux transporter n=1 Tax=Gracilibacillus caseinilyticus TaxID=2932256 RepID=A0ABY4F015_9BACI|nr:MATE family efflux transporter [Gracilibacillus caseinilyticus]UOQ50001.1 MATE family efflux transporter [Gracilibacillus caseinilyticus]
MSKHRDFTKGNIWTDLFHFSSPIMFAQLLQVSYQFVDSIWVGNLIGANALGAVNIAGTVIFTVLSFIIGINNTTLTVLSQQKGKGNERGVARYVNAFVVTLTALGIMMGVIGFVFAEAILQLLDTPSSMLVSSIMYLRINAIGILFLIGYNFISTALRAVGDSKTPLKFVSLAVLLNIVLDPLFISVFHLGVQGAAVATILSQGFAFIYGVLYVVRKKIIPLKWPVIPQISEVKLILNLGIPSGLQMAVISAGAAAIISVVAGYGEDAVAGYSAAQRLDSLFLLPAHALSATVNSMAGQNIGVGKWERVKKIATYGIIYNLAVMLLVAVIISLFAEFGMRLFIQEEGAVQFGASYLMVIAFFYPFLGINFVLNGIVRASGAMYQVLVLNLLSFWALRYPLSYLFSEIMGEDGIGYGIGISFMISSIFAFLYYRYGKWRQKRIFA